MPSKPWHGLPLPIDDKVRALFAASVVFHLGDGERLLFWTDRWLGDNCFKDLAPNLFNVCTRKKLMVAQAMKDQRWLRHLKRDIPQQAVIELVTVWVDVAIQAGVDVAMFACLRSIQAGVDDACSEQGLPLEASSSLAATAPPPSAAPSSPVSLYLSLFFFENYLCFFLRRHLFCLCYWTGLG
jgi:predicted lipid carrier protein YhbT